MKITDFNVKIAKQQTSKKKEVNIAQINTVIRNADKLLKGELYKLIRRK